MWNIFNKINKELRFKILKIRVRKNIELNIKFNAYYNIIKVKCLNDGLIFEVHNFNDENLSKIENKSLLKSILIEEYNKILKEKKLSIKNSKEKELPPKFLYKGNII